ncbi:MAG TPA: hypothetical protein VGL86_03660 [Polyangia bacterium]
MTIAIGVIAILGSAVAAAIALAVVREAKPLHGAALDAAPAAQAYREGVTRVLAARWPQARPLDFPIRDPQMRVRGFEIDGAAPPIVLLHGGGSSAIPWVPLLERQVGDA